LLQSKTILKSLEDLDETKAHVECSEAVAPLVMECCETAIAIANLGNYKGLVALAHNDVGEQMSNMEVS